MRRPRGRGPRLLAAVTVAVLVLAGCSGDPETPATSADPDPTPVEAAWNPCDSLDADAVIALLGGAYTVRRGTPEAPTCSFVPETDGDPVVDVNYDTFTGSLTELLETFGDPGETGTKVGTPQVPGAADARLVVSVDDDGFLNITGFVRNGILVQLVNLVDPPPFDRAGALADVESLMADLAAGAESSGLTG